MSRFIKTAYHYVYFGCPVHKKVYRFCNVDIFSVCRIYGKEKVIYVMLNPLLDRSYGYGYTSLFGTHRMLRHCRNLCCRHTGLFL
jgi:hypothetical protein